MASILDPVTIGDLELSNRMAMAPMTRARAGENDEPTDLVVEYYAQRASAGLIISEGVYPSIEGKGYFATPGIETEAQTEAWKRVTDAVHARGGRIFLQLMHCGRAGHVLNKPGVDHIGPSAIAAEFPVLTREQGLQPMSTPRALETDEIAPLLDRFEKAAANTKAAGFDGIELHAASGYLPHQFLSTNANHRTDAYGGSPEARCRFTLEAMERLVKVFGPKRAAIKLAPGISFNGIQEEQVDETYRYLLKQLDAMGLAYLHFQSTISYQSLLGVDPKEAARTIWEIFPYAFMRENYSGTLMAAGDLTLETANIVLDRGMAELFAFGRPYISNPDLPERFRSGADLTPPNPATFYGGGAEGLIDYPALA